MALRIKHSYEEHTRVYRIEAVRYKAIGLRRCDIATQERKVCNMEIKIIAIVVNGNVELTVRLTGVRRKVTNYKNLTKYFRSGTLIDESIWKLVFNGSFNSV